MKRRFLLVLTVFTGLISIYSVHAQEETTTGILGLDLSSLLIALPVIMVLISLIFFLGSYFKDHYKSIIHDFKVKFGKENLKESKIGTFDYPQEVRALQKQIKILKPEEAMIHLSNIANRFFKEKFSINYELSHGELEKRLEKEKSTWISFPEKLSRLKYSGEPVSRKELKDLTKEFWNIVNYEKRKEAGVTVTKEPKKRRFNFKIGILKKIGVYLAGVFKKVKTDATKEMKIQAAAINKVRVFFSNKLIRKRTSPVLPKEKEEKKLAYKKKISLLSRLEGFGNFFTKKKEAIAKSFQQTQKHVSDQMHNLTQKTKTKPPEKEHEKAIIVKTNHELNPRKPLVLSPLLSRLKGFGNFFTKKKEAIAKSFQQTQKHVSDQMHNLTQKTKTKTPVKAELMPSKPPLPPPIPAKKKELTYKERALNYLKNKEEQGMHKVKPSGKGVLEKIKSVTMSMKKSEQRGITALKSREKGVLDSLTSFFRKDKEEHVAPIKEERRPWFLDHITEKKTIPLNEQKLQKDEERLIKPVTEIPKVRIDIERFKKLQEEEEKVMKEIQKMPKTQPRLTQQVQEEPLRKYEWEVLADEIRNKKTRGRRDLLKEEKDVASKLKELE